MSPTKKASRNTFYSLVPRPRPAFHALQFGKAGRAWYLFSRKHESGENLQNSCVSRIVQPTTHSVLGVYGSHHLLDKLTGTLGLFAVLGPVRPHTIRPFLPSFLSLRHSREKDDRPSFPYYKRRKAGHGLRTRLDIQHVFFILNEL